MKPLSWSWLGRIGFRAACELEESLRRRILDGDEGAETLLLVEHDPVLTLGRSAREEHILVGRDRLRARGVEVERTTRGGGVTYHGPGQLVAYPVLRLLRGVVAHVEALAQAAITVAAGFGVAAEFRRDCPGVWTADGEKLAAVGIQVHRRVAIHGLALNVSTALEAFDWIVPCGLAGTRAASLQALTGRTLAPADVARGFAEAFAAAVGRTPCQEQP